MARRTEPVRKKPEEILSDVLAGAAEAALHGAASAQRFLEKTLSAQGSLPNGVKFFASERLAEYAYQSGDAEACEAAASDALARWPDAVEQFSRELRDAMPRLTFLERAIAVRRDRGDIAGAIELCTFALENGFGRHYEAKRASLERAK